MLSTEEALRALDGIGRLARLDRSAGEGFGKDLAACARSFGAYALVLPAIGILVAIDVDAHESQTPGRLAVALGIAMAIQLAGLPLLLRRLLRFYGREERWAWFVTAYNWFNAATMALLVVALGLFAGPLGAWPFRGIQLYLLVLEAFLAEAVLDIGGLRAAGIVLLDVFFSLGVDGIGHVIGGADFF